VAGSADTAVSDAAVSDAPASRPAVDQSPLTAR
jgi:hypothetical protein